MDIPPLETQREIYKELENEKTLVADEEVYLISAQWLQRFKHGTESTCGPINNRQFLINNKLSLEKKREKFDYEIITKDMWETLHSWYQGGPTITLKVFNTDTGPKVILSELELQCYFDSYEPKKITTNEYVKAKDLREQVMKMFDVPFNEETELWDYYQNEFRNEMKDENELRKYNLINGQAIFLVKKKEKGKWCLEKDIFHELLSNDAQEKPNICFQDIKDTCFLNTHKTPNICFQDIKDTCFLNALVQCLIYNRPLMEYINFRLFWDKKNNESELNIADVFIDLVNFVWFDESRTDSLDTLKKIIKKHAPQFLMETDIVTYDSFYKDLLSNLHEFFKRKNDKNESIITDVFHGQFRRELTCPICGSTKTDFIPYSIIPPPAKKSRKVTYVPLKYTDPYIKMNIEIPPHPSNAVISKIISNYLKKDVKVVLGAYRFFDYIEWEVYDDSGLLQPHICAFEVENFDSYLIPCKLSMREKITNIPKIIGKPFLLSFDHPNPTEEEISNCAFNHLKCLWDTNDELDPTDFEYIKNIVENENYYSKSVDNKFANKPIVAKIPKNYSHEKQLCFDSNYPNLEKLIIDINLNPLFMKNDPITKFSYYKLYCHLKPNIEKPYISLKNYFSKLCRTRNLGYGNEWKCPKCNQDVYTTEKLSLWRVPYSLIIDVRKINLPGKLLEYDAELDLTDFFVGQNEYIKEAKYKLCSVVECRSCQYTSHVYVNNQKQAKGKWYFFDKSGIYESDEQSAINESACILFYERVMNYTLI